jgi:pyruvate decarboxylase
MNMLTPWCPVGKGAVNETHPNYGGVYAGEGSQPEVKDRVEASDLILTIGAIKVRFVYLKSGRA